MSRLKLAVVGGGHLGRIHAKLANANEQFELVAIADPSSTSQASITQQLGLSVVADYHELLGKVDAAIVATPTVSHYEVTSALLRAGVHCLVEKPLATSADQAHRLVQIAKSHSRVLQVGHVERFNPKWTTAVPELGKPKYVEAVRCGSYSGRSTDIGVVMDLMIHDLDLILSLDRSNVQEIQASGLALLGTHEDLAEARLTFASGLVANLKASRVATTARRCMQLYTTDCFAEIDFNSDQLKIVRPSQDVIARLVALDALAMDARMAMKDRVFETYFSVESLPAPGRNAILDEQNDFALSIQTGTSPAVTGEDGARAVEIAGRIVDAIAQRRWDGQSSRSWRIGAGALAQPRIIPIRPNIDSGDTDTTRRVG
jgi:predicted dehydrogenase